jgi:glycosyltransferase involved in cell wall biosynthesis
MNISVIIPTWNRAGRLITALESVYAQTRLPTEVIVVDDGSEDDTRSRVLAAFPGVRYIHQQNRGVSSARNTGIRAASGDWIALLDSDDRWLAHKLAQQCRHLESEPSHRVVHCDEIWIRNGIRVNPMKKHVKQGGYIFRHCLPLCAISPSAVLIHRSVFDAVGLFDEELPACEDYDLWLRICARYPVLFTGEALVIKTGGHADQLSRRYWGMDRFRIHALDKLLSSGVLAPGDYLAARDTLLEKLAILIKGALKHGNEELVRLCRETEQRYQPPLAHTPGAGA